jgi:phosphoglycerate dehydrogenase-like enzyme
MKIILVGNTYQLFEHKPQDDWTRRLQFSPYPNGISNSDNIGKDHDAEVIIADPMVKVSGSVIRALPNLRMIQSEGVAYDEIEVSVAHSLGIPVCNCKGVNADAVAEQTILLMLGLLRNVIVGDAAVRAGKQGQMKKECAKHGIKELSECTVGFIGFGDIARATAEKLAAFGCNMFCYSHHPIDKEILNKYDVEQVELAELAIKSDIVSIHVPVNKDTVHMINSNFFKMMKDNSYIINTARGEIIDDVALKEAIISGKLAGAGLDTVYPEPVTDDNILLNLPYEASKKILFSPHIGGITSGSLRRGDELIWENVKRILYNEKPLNCVK